MAKRADFSDLLSQAQKLSTDIQHDEELPSVRRNLQQIAEAGQRLLSKTTGVVDDSTDVKAAILLGSRGFDVPRISQKLEGLNSVKTLEPIEPVWETDIQGFLRNERENTLLAIIEESRKNTFAEAERHHWDSMEKEWEKEKEKILNSLLGTNQELEFPTDTEIMHSTPLSLHGKSILDAVAMAYARELFIRNESKLRELSCDLVNAFHNASLKFADKQAKDAWGLLKVLVDVPCECLSDHAYERRTEMTTQRLFMYQARLYLEGRYLDFIRDTVHQNPAQARLGGQPGTRNLVKGFLKIRRIPQSQLQLLEERTASGLPVWAMVFYCLRCGDLEDAIVVLREVGGSCAEFAVYLQEYMHSKDHRLPPTSETKLQLIYKRSVRNSTDPFKKAVYCVLACCEVLEDHREVCNKTEDYMWLKICQLSYDHLDSRSSRRMDDKITLPELQHLLLEEYGELHFNALQQPYIYFTVLLLTLQFEAAIEFLSRIEALSSHAVHFAIALHDRDFLYLTEHAHSMLLVKDPTGIRRLNFARLIIRYTRQFAVTNVREALQYFFLLKGMCDAQSKDLFSVCVGELVMESKEFELLLGQVLPDGTVKPGAVDKFQSDTSKVIDFVASDAEEKGLYEDAIHLYDLAKNHTKVLELISRQLSHVVSIPATPQSDRERLQVLAVSIAERYRTYGHSASRQLSQTFHLLLDIMQFFDHYHASRSDTALEVMKQLQLLPLLHEDTVEKKVDQFRNYDNEVRYCLPDILLATTSILYTLYKQSTTMSLRKWLKSKSEFTSDLEVLKEASNAIEVVMPETGGLSHKGRKRKVAQSAYSRANSPRVGVAVSQDGGLEKYKSDLRRQARQLIVFAGMLPYQMPGDTNARLVQMEVLMR